MLIRKLFLVLTAFFLLLASVNAETGNLTIDAGTSSSFDIAGASDGATGIGTVFTTFNFDNTDYNYIHEIDACLGCPAPASTVVTYPKVADSTAFTITAGGTGSGIVTYNVNSGGHVFWIFDSNSHITASSFTLTYSNNIFSGLTMITQAGCFCDANKKNVGAGIGSPVTIAGSAAGNSLWDIRYVTSVSKTFTNIYSVTYSNIGGSVYYNASINKAISTVNSKIDIRNATASKFLEPTFNTNSFVFTTNYDTGIVINMTDASGNYGLVIVNSTGLSAPTPIPGTGGSVSGQIYFDFSTASLTFPYGINVSLASANWSDTLSPSLRIKVIDPQGNLISGFPIDFSNQTYTTSRLWSFQRTGTYNASLYTCDLKCLPLKLLGLTDGTLLDTAILTISQSQYNYSINADANSYSTGDIVHLTIVNPSPSIIYLRTFPQAGGSGLTNVIVDQQIPANTPIIINSTVTGDMPFGTWEAALYTQTGSFGKVASDTYTIGMPLPGTKVSIRWDTNAAVGETNNLYFTTNANISTVKVYKVLPRSNVSTLTDSFTTNNVGSPKQYLIDVAGLWNATITDNGNASNTSSANMTVIASIQELGCNKNLPDYVCWDKASYFREDAFVINWKATNIPSGILSTFVLRLVIYDPDGTMIVNSTVCEWGAVVSKPCNLGNPNTGTYSKTFSPTAKFGKWQASLVLDGTSSNSYKDGTQLSLSYATVVDTGNPINASSLPNSPRAMIDGWTALFNMGINDVSRFLFAILFIMAGMFTGFMLSGRNLYGGVFGAFVPFAFFAYINYVPTWVSIIVAIVVALKIGWFR